MSETQLFVPYILDETSTLFKVVINKLQTNEPPRPKGRDIFKIFSNSLLPKSRGVKPQESKNENKGTWDITINNNKANKILIEKFGVIGDNIHAYFEKNNNNVYFIEYILKSWDGKSYEDAKLTDTTPSVFLGIFLSVAHKINKWKFKPDWDSITATGTFVSPSTEPNGELNLASVTEIPEKYMGQLQKYAKEEEHDKEKHLFLYVSNDESLDDGALKTEALKNEIIPAKNIQVKAFSPTHDTFFDILAYVFELPDLPAPLDVDRKGFFDDFKSKTDKFKENKPIASIIERDKESLQKIERNSLFIHGVYGSGKSYLAFQIARNLVWNNKIYAPIWIPFNNDKAMEFASNIDSGQPGINENTIEMINLPLQILNQLFEIFKVKQYKSLIEKLTQKDKPYLIIIDGLNLSGQPLNTFLSQMQSFCNLIKKNRSRVIFTSNVMHSQPGLNGIENYPLPKPTKDEVMAFVNGVLERKSKAKIIIEGVKQDQKENYERFGNLLYEDYGNFSPMIEFIIDELELSDKDSAFMDILNTMNINSTKSELTEKFAIRYEKIFQKLSDDAKKLLLYLLNFSFDDYIPPSEKLKEDINDIISKKYREEREIISNIITDKIETVFDELFKAKFIIRDNNTGQRKITDIMTYKTLFFEEQFSSKDASREKLISKKRMLKESIMHYIDGEEKKEKQWNILRFKLDLFKNLSEIEYEDGCNILHGIARFCTDMDVFYFLWDKCPGLFSYIDKYGEIQPVTDDKGQTALHYAAAHNQSPEVLIWLLKKADELHIDDYLWKESSVHNMAIHFAAEFNKSPVIMRLLLDEDIDIKKTINQENDYGLTPLLYACWHNTPEIVELLLNKELCNASGIKIRPDITHRTKKLLNLVHLCAYRSDGEIDYVKKIIEKIMNTDKEQFESFLREKDDDGNIPLHYAARFVNKTDIIQMLYISPDDLNARTNEGFTPLHNAAGYNTHEVVSFLIKKGARIDNYSFDLADSIYPIHYAAQYSNDLENIDVLCDKNHEYINIQDKCGFTPLHYAAAVKEENFKMIIKLIALEADRNIPDKKGFTPLHVAIMTEKKSSFIDRLITPENVEIADYFGNTPLHYAVKTCPYLEIIEKLITNNTINRLNSQGATPLKIALHFRAGNGVVQKLRTAGACI